MLERVAALLAHPRRDHLDALVTEAAVKAALRTEGHPVAGFGLWALRRRARRQDPLERLLRQPRDWTWLAFAPCSPHDLPAGDASLLARVAGGLHGVTFLQWALTPAALTFTAWPLRVTTLRGEATFIPGSPRLERVVPLPDKPTRMDVTRWPGVPPGDLLGVLVESYYVEHLAVAEPGAFTNVDVLAFDGTRPVVVEVKRRTREEAAQDRTLALTTTQAGTLHHLQKAGCEVHFALLVVPPGARAPEDWLTEGRWRAGAATLRPGWGEALLDVWGEVPAPTLDALRAARQEAAGRPASDAPASTAHRQEDGRSTRKARREVPRLSPPRATLSEAPPSPPPPRRLTSFSREYAFLSVWAPVTVRLGGRTYGSVGTAFLAARTLDEGARAQLAEMEHGPDALRVARRASIRPDWDRLRPTVAREVLRVAYRNERARQLVATLPLLLADGAVLDQALVGVQGRAGLQALEALRGHLAEQEAHATGDRCLSCAFAVRSAWPGFVRCAHPSGPPATLGCVGKAAVQGPRGSGTGVLVPVTTPGGPAFRPVSEEPARRS
ncbi:NADAR family protein [Deinococcus geothermalis]|nr:NADAR family protein [Deinococcus geothermalis]